MAFDESRDAAELKRRIRRVFSVLRSMAAHMGAHTQNSEDAALHLSGRIGAIARAVLAPVSPAGMDLESLVLDELLVYPARRNRVFIRGAGVRLDAKSAELMSLVIHELATNAVKYGALSQAGAQITVGWWHAYRVGLRWLHFEWLESGVHTTAGAGHEAGFGSALVERLIASELHGEGKMALLPGGMRYTIDIPTTGTDTRADDHEQQ